MTNSSYDVVVIGAGPAGYVCAIRCAQLDMRVACIDDWLDKNGKPCPGGTCLNVGCIPSKALLDSSHHYSFLEKDARQHGIQCEKLKVDVAKMQQRKEKVVKTLTTGVKGLLKKNNIEFLCGTASVRSASEVEVKDQDQCSVLNAQKIIIASGSKPLELEISPVDQNVILDSTGALALSQVPKHLGVIGAGVIGLEMASIWSRLGAKVTMWEAEQQFLPSVDSDVAVEANKILSKQGINILLNRLVKGVEKYGDLVKVTTEGPDGLDQTDVDRLLVAVGRVANTAGLDLDQVGVRVDSRGFIEVDDHWQTSIGGIYAIGDVIGGAMLAHKGSDEGIALAEHLAGQYGHVNYNAIPWVIYTWPEIAWAGESEQSLTSKGMEYSVGSFPFMALGRARALGESAGFIKLIADANTDQLLGAHIIGPNASEMIAEAVVAIESELSAEDLARTIHSHPTLSEGMHEAALAVDNRAIHV